METLHKIKRIVAKNKRVHYDYFILDTWECGVCLQGGEVKTIRQYGINISESHVRDIDNELWIYNMQLSVDLSKLSRPEHQMPRKLLLNRREIDKICGRINEQRLTVVPLQIYFDASDRIKMTIALVQGKKKYDKRQVIKDRDWERTKSRFLKT